MINAISFLFERHEIPPDVIKQIMLYSLDAYNGKGEFGKSGTSSMAMMFLSNWLNQFGKVKDFPIFSEYHTGPEVCVGQNSILVSSLQQGGVAVVRLRYGCWHYALLTGSDDHFVYLFDPYYRIRPFVIDGAEIISDAPTQMNRRVSYDLLNETRREALCAGTRSHQGSRRAF